MLPLARSLGALALVGLSGCSSPEPAGKPDEGPSGEPALVMSPGEGTGTCEAPVFPLELRNDGTVDLVVTGFDLVGATVEAETPFEIAPGASVEVEVVADAPGSVVVGVLSNDPAGAGYAAFTVEACAAPPVAVCTAEAGVGAGGEIRWEGDGSYSPTGLALDYTWALVARPADSAAVLEGAGANRTTVADLPGEYVAELRVVDTEGLASDICEATIVVE